ncbi:hypothetical protein Tco_0806183 [Tanacetum coccineum]
MELLMRSTDYGVLILRHGCKLFDDNFRMHIASVQISVTAFGWLLYTTTQLEAIAYTTYSHSGRAILLMTGAPEQTTGSGRHLDESHRLQRVSSNGMITIAQRSASQYALLSNELTTGLLY